MPGVTRSKLMRAEARADRARSRFRHTLGELKARLTPAALAETAQEEIADAAEAAARKGAEIARRHRVKVIGAATLIAALVAGRWLRKRKRRREATR